MISSRVPCRWRAGEDQGEAGEDEYLLPLARATAFSWAMVSWAKLSALTIRMIRVAFGPEWGTQRVELAHQSEDFGFAEAPDEPTEEELRNEATLKSLLAPLTRLTSALRQLVASRPAPP